MTPDDIVTPNGLPTDFSKSPQQLADEINSAMGPDATPDQVHDAVAKVNAGARAAAQLAAGVDPQEISQEDPIYEFTQHFFSILTPQLRAILGAGVPIRAELSCTDPKTGTLQLDVHPAKLVQRIDEENKRVILAADADGNHVDPADLPSKDA